MRKTVSTLAALVVLPLAMTMASPTSASAVSTHKELTPGCVTTPGTTSDDSCTLYKGSYNVLTGQMDANINVLLNDGFGPDETPAVSDFVKDENGNVLDPAIGTVVYVKDSSGYSELDLIINPEVTDPFTFSYRASNGTVSTVTVTPVDWPPMPEPSTVKPAKVTKAKEHGKTKKGYLHVCAPASGPSMVFIWGNYGDPTGLYDGHTTVRPGKKNCKDIQVHRTAIDWEAYALDKAGSLAGAGHIKGIKLPKGDHLPRLAS